MAIWARGAQGRVRARVPHGCVPFAVRAGWAAAFRTRGVWEPCAPGLGPLWCFMGASPGCPGRALWASRARFCVPPRTWRTARMWPCVLPASQHRNAVYMFDPRPAPLLVTCGPPLSVPLCPVDLGRGEAGGQFALPRESQKGCILPVGPNYILLPARYTWVQRAF